MRTNEDGIVKFGVMTPKLERMYQRDFGMTFNEVFDVIEHAEHNGFYPLADKNQIRTQQGYNGEPNGPFRVKYESQLDRHFLFKLHLYLNLNRHHLDFVTL